MASIKERKYSGCLHPMLAVKDGYNPSGAVHWKIIGACVDPDTPEIRLGLHMVISCGHCINCRLAHSRQWADRLMLENEYHEQSWFVTLTYNDFWVPESKYVDENTGEVFPAYSLWKRDVQLFLKRLRKSLDYSIRFYCAGEYGSKTFRPHYHLIIFGLRLDEDDLYNPRCGHSGFTLYQSHSLERAWSKVLFDRVWPLGHVAVAPVTWQTCAYVSRYVTKKLYGDFAQYYEYFNIEPPFSTMSRKPGLAKQYYLDHPEIMEKGSVCLSTADGGRRIRTPKYFDRLFEVDFPEDSVIIKETKRRQARLLSKLRRDTDLDFFEYLSQEEERAIRISEKLIRNEV